MLFLITVSIGQLAWVFFKSICIAVPIIAIEGIDNIDSEGSGGVFNFLFLVLVMTVLFSLFLSSFKIFKVSSLVFTGAGDRAWFMIFSIQVFINYLNNSLLEGKTVKVGVEVRARLRVDV